ncbi:DUF3040 domain-containing protein [Longispora sp. K20-0274]|uniref:DUF3040 domain-containing protein n=1 Tax=Longispora sp. K20-0274 TaxID=3088255 RepID=UPI00399ADBFC
MLSQDDRRRLEAIESRLEADDPRFVARMRRPRPRAWIWMMVGYALVGVGFPVLAAVADWPAVLPALVLAVALAVGAWHVSRDARRRDPGRVA